MELPMLFDQILQYQENYVTHTCKIHCCGKASPSSGVWALPCSSVPSSSAVGLNQSFDSSTSAVACRAQCMCADLKPIGHMQKKHDCIPQACLVFLGHYSTSCNYWTAVFLAPSHVCAYTYMYIFTYMHACMLAHAGSITTICFRLQDLHKLYQWIKPMIVTSMKLETNSHGV